MVKVSENDRYTEPAANRGRRKELLGTLDSLDSHYVDEWDGTWTDVECDSESDVKAYRTAWVGLANEHFAEYNLKLRTRTDGRMIHGHLVPRPAGDVTGEAEEAA